MFDLTGKGALVTGATGGIGGAIAKALHAQGANVAISGTNEEKLDALAAELGSRVFVLPCDLRDRAAVVKLGEEAEKALGQVDILVNNAGITHDNLFMRMKDEEWDDVIAVNLTSVFVLTRDDLAQYDAPPRGPHRQYRLDLGRARQSGAGELCRFKGRAGRHDQVARPRGVFPRHHRQLHRPGLHLDPHDRCLDAEASRGYCRRHPSPEVRQARGCGGGGGLPCQRRSRLYHGRDDACQRRNGDDVSRGKAKTWGTDLQQFWQAVFPRPGLLAKSCKIWYPSGRLVGA